MPNMTHRRRLVTHALWIMLIALAACAAPSTPLAQQPTSTPLTMTPTIAESPPASATATPESSTATPAAGESRSIALVTPQNELVLIEGAQRRTIATLPPVPMCGDLGWSPDGYRLATPDGIYTLRDDPTDPPLFAPIIGTSFRWSPDGQRLAWLAGVDEHLDVIRVGGPDGANAVDVGGAHWGYTGLIAWDWSGQIVLSGALEAYADGSDYRINEGIGRNPVYSPTDDALAWTTFEITGTTATIEAHTADHNEFTWGTITVELADSSVPSFDLERPRLRWLPDGSAFLIPLPDESLRSGGGTYIARPGAIQLVSPHIMCDLAPDGERMLARTDAGRVVVVRIADGAVEADLGAGFAAAWRPATRGPAPDAPLATMSPTLRLTEPRIEGEAVRELQQRLTDQGFDPGPIDGIFGPQTEAAVRAFQRAAGLEDDGIVGPWTWAWLRFDAVRATEQFFAQP